MPGIRQHGRVTQLLGGSGGQAAPAADEPAADALAALGPLIACGRVAVLSGAGLSTESGIPDYRGPTGLARRAQPMTYQAFTGGAAARQRYWARSHEGWRHIAAAVPNSGHRAIAELERRGLLAGIITQNVDGLHQAAGARQVTELHGSLSRVRCLGCGARSSRRELDRRLREANPDWDRRAAVAGRTAQVNPDGDAVLSDAEIDGFQVVDCTGCGGVLKPDVIFFGENVPKTRVEDCYALVNESSALLVLGSSLTVMSGYRFVRHAASLALPVAIINQGTTRGDADATITLAAPLGATLTALLTRLPAHASQPRNT